MDLKWQLCVLLISLIFTGCKSEEIDPCTWKTAEPGQFEYCHVSDSNEADCQSYVNYTLKPCIDEDQNFEWVENYDYSLIINVKNPREEDLFLIDVQKIVALTLEDCDLTTVPEDVYNMTRLKEITIFNEIRSVDFYKFSSMPSLNKINLANNQITVTETDDVSNNNSNVKDLDLSYNLIEVIPDNFVKPFSKLERLDLSHNKIKSIGLLAFEGIIHLEILDISYNGLVEVGNGFLILPNLIELSLSNNHITKLSNSKFEELIKLDKLYVDNNLIERITIHSFVGLERLKTLDISNNRLTKVGYALAKLSSLLELIISNNKITKLQEYNFITQTNLEELDVSFNSISAIDTDALEPLTKLQALDLSHNQIEKISKELFVSNTNLTWLSLLDNKIETIEPNSFKENNISQLYIQNNKLKGSIKTGTFRGINETELNLSVGNITSICDEAFSDMTHLKNLNLSANTINNISYLAFSSLVSLNVLDMSYNQLQELNFESESLRNLYKLYAHHNKIENILINVFENFVSLQELDLSYNDIKAIEPYQFLNKLSYLDLSSNTEMKIIGDPFQNISQLNRLSLQNVKSEITFENSSTSVTVLDMQSCGIIDINIVYIYNVQNVVSLNLSMNEIAVIDKNSFKTMPSLVNLDLSLNKITYIQPGTFLQTKALNILNLYGNSLQSIQYGVFDGLDVLSDLNLAKNFLRKYDVKLKPVIARLSLDDNLISNFNFKELFFTETSELSIGGNQIPCVVFAELKYSNYSEKFRQIVTAKSLSYYTENINGISCQNGQNDTSIILDSQNAATNLGPLISILKSSLDKMSVSLQIIGENTHKTETSLKALIEENREKLTSINHQLMLLNKHHERDESNLDDTVYYVPVTDVPTKTPSDYIN